MMNSATLRDGVELDAFGCPTGYWFASHHPYDIGFDQGMPTYTRLPAMSRATGMPLVLHVLEQLRPGQTRGVPELATVLRQLKQLDRFTDAELAATVIASFFTVFIKRTGITGEEGRGLAAATDDDEELGELANLAGGVKLQQGGVVELEEGDDITIANPGRPNAQYDPFVSSVAKFMGVALGLPASLVLKTFNASYSASRAELLEAWRTFEQQQDWLVATFCAPVREWVISECVARGLLDAPGFDTDPLVRAAYLGAMWTGPVATQLDPLKEVTAAARRVQAGFSTRAIETPQLTGQSWRDVHRQLVKERAARVADGLDPKELVIPGLGGQVVVDQSPNTAPGDRTDDEADGNAGGNADTGDEESGDDDTERGDAER
jgi:lambda family phage portal protein